MERAALQVGIDFSQKTADFCLLSPDGQVIDRHQGFANSAPGFRRAKAYLLASLAEHAYEAVHVSGEATSYYWMPFFLQLFDDAQLQAHGLQLFLDNPKQVYWFKKSFAEDNKTDQDDAYYIAERNRTRPKKYAWAPQKTWLALRFYTRLRFHLGQALTREKNYFQAYLFLRSSAYASRKPFTNTFGATSGLLLQDLASLSELEQLPVEDLAAQLDELSGHRLPDPKQNARKLRQITTESFPVEAQLAAHLQQILNLVLANIRFLEKQAQQVEAWIAAEVDRQHPEVRYLEQIQGIGLYTAAGIAAEIGDLRRFFEGQKWDKRKKRWRAKTLKDVEDAVAKSAGLWWPRKSSGTFEAQERRMSKKGNRYLRYYLVEGADRMRRHVPEYASYYAKKKREVPKYKHKRALVLTARKSVGLFVGLLHRKEPYCPKEG